ncbi:MAG: hypothetical protein O2910_00785 [Proteobacteria bacterium]|jgi:hypothetical protein|nr:hypothetical protein [Pseudomonadota bacterium]
MVREQNKRAKTQTLSLRLDPKVRFALEFAANSRRQSITSVVEDAIVEWANQVKRGDKNWLSYWDVSEGKRHILQLFDPISFLTFDEEREQDFVSRHADFFRYRHDEDRGHWDDVFPLDSANVDVLWPKFSEYLDIWNQKRSEDYWAAGREMKKDLEAAGLKSPTWPPPDKAAGAHRTARPVDDDDKIPF